MNRLGKQSVVLVGILFHLVYLWSIFDIYFITPLVHGMRQYVSTPDAPADRLFLIVGDGLRADKCLEPRVDAISGEAEYMAPYLRSRILEAGTFGISHTRMPTESRPGHVAIIAGFYEDVSAVTKGWKENPVDFDSVFNQSAHTWSFGSPDILPMFAQGASDAGRVDTYMYGHEFEDFTADTRELDTYVFEHVEALFANASSNAKLNAALRQKKVVFFLHLLGIDTAGHASRPYSEQYLRNIQHVDAGVQRVVKLVNDFYRDDKTAWVFTADHGMSDWGSHGDGHPDNTRTPLIAWGAGVARPDKVHPTGHDEYSRPWNLNAVKRNDVEQADIASLMSYLVGVNYPANSVGRLPLEFVDAPLRKKSRALFNNALEIVEQYRVKEAQTRASKLRYTPFAGLHAGSTDLDTVEARGEQLMHDGDYRGAIDYANEIIGLGLEGLRYLQTYNWLFLRSLVTMGFVGWILYGLTSFLDVYILPEKIAPSGGSTLALVALTGLSSVFALFYMEHAPAMYYLYAVFPFFFWESVFEYRNSLVTGLRILIWNTAGRKQNTVLGLVAQVAGFLALMEATVAGYFHREVFSVVFMLMSFWPVLQNRRLALKHKGLSALWFVCCWIMSVFTLLPVVKTEDLRQILAAGALMVALGLGTMVYLVARASRSTNMKHALSAYTMTLFGLQLGIVLLSMFVTASTVQSLQAQNGLPLGNQVVGWLTLGGSLVLPFLHYRDPHHDRTQRLLVLFLAFAPTFVLLTISYEGLFYVAFFVTLVLWVDLEGKIYSARQQDGRAARPAKSPRKASSASTASTASTSSTASAADGDRRLELADARIALFFFFLTQVAFFGTGNVASISSFSLDSVYRLLPVFDPFLMGALLLFKILAPFAVISADLGLLTQVLRVKPSSLFTMVLSISDILTLNFFYLVRDEGSWLDIGMSISHYCIASLLCVFVIALEYLSVVLVNGVV
ncbi:Phosphatidylinositolglycan class N-domain-containing protein [Dipodascopsis tothii]|uniref:Phosphatidylinositolglycan class N-domain-containing protein n=1 Tax=Dipodascopsis tothii TaxID=44089 RepID=UPI0034CEDCEC